MNGFEKWWNDLSRGIKILLVIITFGVMGFVARLIKFLYTKDSSPLIGFILCLVPIVGFVMWIIDIITTIGKGTWGILYETGSLDDLTKKEEEKKETVDAEATEVKDDSDETGEAEPEVKEEEATDTEEKAE
jgi:flagellar biosynthesis/type III secretory pathway M-ring protein FliF/YscJ